MSDQDEKQSFADAINRAQQTAEARADLYLGLLRRTIEHCDESRRVRGRNSEVIFPGFLERLFRAAVAKAGGK